jgi:hypothetical protein
MQAGPQAGTKTAHFAVRFFLFTKIIENTAEANYLTRIDVYFLIATRCAEAIRAPSPAKHSIPKILK